MVLRKFSFALAALLALIACNSFKFDDELPGGSSSGSSSSDGGGVPPSGSSSSLSPSSGDGGGPSSSSSPDGASSSSEEASSSSVSCADADKCGGRCYDKDAQFCQNGTAYDRCGGIGGSPYNVNLKICCGGAVRDKADYGCCADVSYLLSGYGCEGGSVLARCGEDGLYDEALQFCAADGSTQWLCGGKPYDYPGQDCVDNVVVGTCGGEELDPSTHFCYGGMPYALCGGGEYNPETHFCAGGGAYAKCGGNEYNPAAEFCSGNAPHALCGGDEYNPETQFCSGGAILGKCGEESYNPQTEFCQSGTDAVKPLCGGLPYASSQRCGAGGVIETGCGSLWYNPSTEFCSGDAVHGKCGGTLEYSPATEACCGSNKYTLASQFCSGGSTILNRCGGTASGAEYNPSTEGCCGSGKYTLASQFCQSGSNAVKELCNGETYSSTQFCSGTSILAKCGGTVEYAPSTEGCCGSGKYILATHLCDSRDSKAYKYVTIGTQKWMAENLNHNASGSKCYADGVSGVSQDSINKNCTAYGRLYNWATALDIAASCNSNTLASCGATVTAKHTGICPASWHLPSGAEWDALMTEVGGSSTAGTKLKANSALWNTNTGTDEFGFSALPGGYGAGGSFYDAGSYGYWWSSTENNARDAYTRVMDRSYANVNNSNRDKAGLYSVRCVQD